MIPPVRMRRAMAKVEASCFPGVNRTRHIPQQIRQMPQRLSMIKGPGVKSILPQSPQARSSRRANQRNGLFLRLIIVFSGSYISVLKEVNCYLRKR
jgi:hypothetical protein